MIEFTKSYRKPVYFNEEQRPIIETFLENISKDWRVEAKCKKGKKNRFSQAIFWLMNIYNEKVSKAGIPQRPKKKEVAHNG